MPAGLSRKIKIVKKVAALAVAALMLEGAGYFYGFRAYDIYYHYTQYPAEKSRIEQQYGIQINGTIESENFPPNEIVDGEIDKYTVITSVKNKFDFSQSISVIADSFSLYPATILNNNLNNAYIVDDLTLGGANVWGTYSIEKRSLYILNLFQYHYPQGEIKRNLEKMLHHEISSVLMKNHQFDTALWRSAIGEGFQYEIDKDPWYQWMLIRDYIEPEELSSEKELLQRGLLRQYAETGVENDFNTYAEVIFGEPKRMRKLISDYPIIARKYQVFKEFYLSIDPGFAPVFAKIDGGHSLIASSMP
ncbi:hypothetical protein [Halioxenophilus aromaticivorans]|uniref:hypothetical protein n=3 Tax=Halioxenophilus aromaticivorans TaxID=1306992 RepID=UPI0036F23DD6